MFVFDNNISMSTKIMNNHNNCFIDAPWNTSLPTTDCEVMSQQSKMPKTKTMKGTTKKPTNSKRNRMRNKDSLSNGHNFSGSVTGENRAIIIQTTNDCQPLRSTKGNSFDIHDIIKEHSNKESMFDLEYTPRVPPVESTTKHSQHTSNRAGLDTFTFTQRNPPAEDFTHTSYLDDGHINTGTKCFLNQPARKGTCKEMTTLKFQEYVDQTDYLTMGDNKTIKNQEMTDNNPSSLNICTNPQDYLNGTVFERILSKQKAVFSNTHIDTFKNICQESEDKHYSNVPNDMIQRCISEPGEYNNIIQSTLQSGAHFINSTTNMKCSIDPLNTFLSSAPPSITSQKNLSSFTTSVTYGNTDLNTSSTNMYSAMNLPPNRNSPHLEQTNPPLFSPLIISSHNVQTHNSFPLISSIHSSSSKVNTLNYDRQSMQFGHIITSNCDNDNMSFSEDHNINPTQNNFYSDSNQYQNMAQVYIETNSHRTSRAAPLDLQTVQAVPSQITSQGNAINGLDSTQTTIRPVLHNSTPEQILMTQDYNTISCSENTSEVQLQEELSRKAPSNVNLASHKKATCQLSSNRPLDIQCMYRDYIIESEKEIKDKNDVVPLNTKDFNFNTASAVECHFTVESPDPISTKNGNDEKDCEIIDLCETDSCSTTILYPQVSTPEPPNAHAHKLYSHSQDTFFELSPMIMTKRHHDEMTPTSLSLAKGSVEICETALQTHTNTHHINHDYLEEESEQQYYKHTDKLSPTHSGRNLIPKPNVIESKKRGPYYEEMNNDTGHTDQGSKNEHTKEEKVIVSNLSSFLEVKEHEVFGETKHYNNHKTIHPCLVMNNGNQNDKNVSMLENDGSYVIIEDIVENNSLLDRSSTPPLIIDEHFEDDKQQPNNIHSVKGGEEHKESMKTFNSCKEANDAINMSNVYKQAAGTADKFSDNVVVFIEDSYLLHKESDTYNLSYDSDSESDDDKNRELDHLLRLCESIKRYLGDPKEQKLLQRKKERDQPCTLCTSPNAKNESCLLDTREHNSSLSKCYYEDISEDESLGNYYENIQISERTVELDKYPSILSSSKNTKADAATGKWLIGTTSGISKCYHEDISEKDSLGNYNEEISESISPDSLTACIFMEDRSDDCEVQEVRREFSCLGWIHNFKETIPIELKPKNIQRRGVKDHDDVKNVFHSSKKNKELPNYHQFNIPSNLSHSTDAPISCQIIQSMPREGAIILDNRSSPTKFSPDTQTSFETTTPKTANFTTLQRDKSVPVMDTLQAHVIAEVDTILKNSEEYSSVLGINNNVYEKEIETCGKRLVTKSSGIILYPKTNNTHVPNNITRQYENVWRLERRQFSNEDFSNEKHRPSEKMECDSLEATTSVNRYLESIKSENANQASNEFETLGCNTNIGTQNLNTSRFHEESMLNQYSGINDTMLGGHRNHFNFNGENINPPEFQFHPKDDSRRPALKDQVPMCSETSEKQYALLCNDGTRLLTEVITKNLKGQSIKASFTSSQTDDLSLSPLKMEIKKDDRLLSYGNLKSSEDNADHLSRRATEAQEGMHNDNHANVNTQCQNDDYRGASPATDRFIQAMAAAIKEEILGAH